MITFQNVTKAFGTQFVLEDASLRINPGERVGIVGPNGAGKSTIFGLLTGELSPDRGEVSVPRSVTMGYLRQQLRPHAVADTLLDYTENAIASLRDIQHRLEALEHRLAEPGGERVTSDLAELGRLQTDFEHQGGYLLRTRAQAALSGLGFEVAAFERPFRILSGGWQMRAELARILVAHPDILLLDEPTNFLDVPAAEWLRSYLDQYKGTLLLVSHDRYLLNSLTRVTLEVNGARVTRYAGNYDSYMRERVQRHDQAAAAERNLTRRREQVERFVERFRAKNTKSSQVQSRIKMLEKLPEITVPNDTISVPRIRLPAPPHCGVEALRLEDAGLTYDNQRWIFRHLDLRVERGEKLAAVGLNGMGKTTLLRVLAGRLDLTEGRLTLGHRVEIGYQSQDFTDVMDPELTVFATARRVAPDLGEQDLRNVLGAFRFGGEAIEKKVDVLSGGEKVRLALARLLLSPGNVLILDEPTTHLDIGSREALEAALHEYAGTVLLVSHDIEFIRHVATGILALTPAGLTRYYGNYDYYREKQTAEAAARQGDDAEARKATAATERRTRKREEAELRQRFYQQRKPLEEAVRAAEKRIAQLEAERAGILEALAAPPAPQTYVDLSRRLHAVQEALAAAESEWEQAGTRLEELQAEWKQPESEDG